MGKGLTPDQIACWRDNGYVAPVDVIAPEEARACRAELEEAERIVAANGWKKVLAYKAHVVLPFLVNIARTPGLLDAVEDVIGPDIVLYDSDFFIKEPQTPGFVSWHQDLTYCGFDGTAMVNCWVALAPSTVESGCLRVVPGSHKLGPLPHADIPDPANMLGRGFTVQHEVGADAGHDLILQPGQASFHHGYTFHGSRPNNSGDRRIGLVLLFVSASMKRCDGRASGLLLRGSDPQGNFAPDPAAETLLDPAMIPVQARLTEELLAVEYAGAGPEAHVKR